MQEPNGDYEEAAKAGSPRAWIVWKAYRIEAGVLMHDSSDDRYDYFPTVSPGVVGEIAKLMPQDERAVLAFAQRWGDLGYPEILEATSQAIHVPYGDPLVWVWAHANGIRTVLKLKGLLDKRAVARLKDYLGSLRLSGDAGWACSEAGQLIKEGRVSDLMDLSERLFAAPPPGPASRTASLTYGSRQRITGSWWPLYGNVLADARRIIATILNPNLRGTFRQVADRYISDDSDEWELQIVRSFDSLLSAAYGHLAELVTGGKVGECRECGAPFPQTDRRQLFCPPPPYVQKSPCGALYRTRVFRQKKKEKEGGQHETRQL